MTTLAPDCHSCARTAELDALPSRERVAVDAHWRVAHAFGAGVLGWLVLLPRRHVVSVAELTDEEAAGLGVWQVRLSRALVAETGCAKVYVAQFAEAPGFGHVHFHLIPRAVELAPEHRGPRVFGLLGDGAGVPSEPERDAFADRLRARLGG
ncbi:HIT family protein [Kitasatospora viridis]|uniref:Diadenosine tetraphosphate (Ap4A) HIT family hydrolase n=1 Tax=Kitasatospora viridis TaxID=281105 RepID=A0A561UK98_9ACTN|nr:HIT family protein [Kitasatospora viridis]TWF99787.1 diadenosine tetraphosphate (Ap4A) HIT family hydrolase [Kitasatospora viridis]